MKKYIRSSSGESYGEYIGRLLEQSNMNDIVDYKTYDSGSWDEYESYVDFNLIEPYKSVVYNKGNAYSDACEIISSRDIDQTNPRVLHIIIRQARSDSENIKKLNELRTRIDKVTSWYLEDHPQ